MENPAYELLDLWNVTPPLCVPFSSIVRINQEQSVHEDSLAYCGGLFCMDEEAEGQRLLINGEE